MRDFQTLFCLSFARSLERSIQIAALSARDAKTHWPRGHPNLQSLRLAHPNHRHGLHIRAGLLSHTPGQLGDRNFR